MTKWSLAYEIIRGYIKQIFKRFYNRIESSGNGNIPSGKPIIFAANHQNALIDPWGVLFTSKEQSVFLTRADIFKNPILLKIFTLFKMLPVYRIRDGKAALKNNERIFNVSAEILEAKMSVGLFPEASHTNKRRLKQLKKAVPRIAFLAESKNNFELDLQIVPVGIYYDDYIHSNSNLFINYGKPFGIKQFKEIYEESEQKGFNALKEVMEDAIKELIIHQPDMANYDLYENIRIYNRPQMLKDLNLNSNKLVNRFKADKNSVLKMEEYFLKNNNDISLLSHIFNNYNNFCKTNSIRIENKEAISFTKILTSELIFILGFPIFLYGLINNFIYYKLIMNFLKKVKDAQFHSSIKLAVSILITTFIYPIHALIFWAISGNGLWALIYLISLPLTVLIANKYRYAWKNFIKEHKFWRLKRSDKYNDYKTLKNTLDNKLKEVMD